jgi:hypothetical protein
MCQLLTPVWIYHKWIKEYSTLCYCNMGNYPSPPDLPFPLLLIAILILKQFLKIWTP